MKFSRMRRWAVYIIMPTKNAWRWIGGLIALLSLIWFSIQISSHAESFNQIRPSSIAIVLLASLIYVMTAVFSGMAWWFLLRGSGESYLSPFNAVSITCVTQIAKYLPGNVAHHIGRVFLAANQRLSKSAALFSIFMETLWTVAIASLVALIAVWTAGARVLDKIPEVPEWWILLGLCTVAMMTPLLGQRFFKMAAQWWSKRQGVELRIVRMPPLSTFWLVGCLYIANYFVLGVILSMIAQTIFHADGGGVLFLSGVFAIAWVTGFVTPGAPAGLGVREVVLVAALSPVYGAETAVGIAAILRVVTLLGDGLVFLVGLALSRFAHPTPASK